MKGILAFLAAISMFSVAHADQCAVVGGNQALTAIKEIGKWPAALKYCQDCGDTQAELVEVNRLQVQIYDVQTNVLVAAVSLTDLAGNNFAAAGIIASITPSFIVYMNGQPIDLAYIFTNAGANVGQLAGCDNTSPAQLPPAIQIEAGMRGLAKYLSR